MHGRISTIGERYYKVVYLIHIYSIVALFFGKQDLIMCNDIPRLGLTFFSFTYPSFLAVSKTCRSEFICLGLVKF